MTQTQANKLNALLAEAQKWWKLACDWDEIDPLNKLIVFSPLNPWIVGHAKAMRRFQTYRNRLRGALKRSEQARRKRQSIPSVTARSS